MSARTIVHHRAARTTTVGRRVANTGISTSSAATVHLLGAPLWLTALIGVFASVTAVVVGVVTNL